MISEREMSRLRGKMVKVTTIDGDFVRGKCVDFTQALDNEPEVPSICINDLDRGFKVELEQNEIESIEVIKS